MASAETSLSKAPHSAVILLSKRSILLSSHNFITTPLIPPSLTKRFDPFPIT